MSQIIEPCRLFTESDIERFIANAGGLVDPTKRDEFAQRLEEIGQWFRHERLQQQKPAPSEVAKKLHAIQGAAQNLLKSLHLRNGVHPDEIPPAILYPLRRAAEYHVSSRPPRNPEIQAQADADYQGVEKLRCAITSVQELKDWAKAAEARIRASVERNIRNSPKRHRGDVATQRLIGGLAGVWINYFAVLPGASVGPPGSESEGKVSGPFIRFVADCQRTMKGNLSRDAFDDDPGLEKALSLSEKAIRSRVRKLGLGRLRSLSASLIN